jgi:hypothetical protein
MTIIKAEAVTFYSALDEKSFFETLSAIKAVNGIKGNQQNIEIDVNEKSLNYEDMSSIYAVLHRYGADTTQLSIFDKKELDLSSWFASDTIWYSNIRRP